MSTIAAREKIAGGRVFRLAGVSGLITGVAADGVLFAWRNPSADIVQHLVALTLKWRTVSGFTAAQEVAIAAHHVTAFDAASPANYAGGTDLSNPASNPAYVNLDEIINSAYSYTESNSKSVLATGNVRIATIAALTHAGTPVIASQPFGWDAFAELAAGASVQKGVCDVLYRPAHGGYQRFGSNAGFVVRAPIALGAGGTGRLGVEVAWFER